jgi:Glutathione-dependent formaldehyde-activating enzyme
MTKVQCRCGATELEITAEPIVQFYCHCDDCQAVHGGAYAPESVYPADAVTVVRGDPTNWKVKRNPYGPGVRVAVHGHYLIFYVAHEHKVVIERILHGSRHLDWKVR